MKKSRQLLGLLQGALFLCVFLLSAYGAASADALVAGDTYSVTLSKMNSDGSLSDVEHATAVADEAGKIDFSFSNVPTSPATHFLVLTIQDSSDAVVRKSFVPAPPEGVTGALGANDLSTVQTDMILSALEGAQTDDPIVAAYGLILTRTPDMTGEEVQSVATLGRLCIREGFEQMLLSNGVTAAQLETFKDKLIYNQPNKDLSNFTALFKQAVDNPDEALDDMSMAAGLIADIFIDAGVASGIDLSLILAAHDAAGIVFESNAEAVQAKQAFSVDTVNVINQSMTNFSLRIGAVKLKASYANAFSVLGAGAEQMTRFNEAVATMMNAMQDLDKQYGQYYENPQSMTQEIADEMNAAYQAAFNSFQTDIAATNDEISTMKVAIAAALGITVGDLPAGLGTYEIWDSNTGQPTSLNWPIPQVVATNWVAAILQAGGGLAYDKATVAGELPIPSNMNWLNNQNYPDGIGQRSDFSQTYPAAFAALMQMQEDVMIAEQTRYYIDSPDNPDTHGSPTGQQRQDAKIAYALHLSLIAGSLSGTTDGATPISDAQKEALVKMMEHPDL